MTRTLTLLTDAPGVTVQDLGRPGQMAQGFSRGGPADRRAFLDGAALVGNQIGAAGLEVTGMGLRLTADAPCRIAVTGADVRPRLDGAALEMNTSVAVPEGGTIELGAPVTGVYAYLHVGGGIETPVELGSRARHGTASIGPRLTKGDTLPIGKDPTPGAAPLRLSQRAVETGPLRVMPGPQTERFKDETRARFAATTFTRSPSGNRQGVRFDSDAGGFATDAQLTAVSDFITEGDIQMTGDGVPYVLLADCQTMGGYPRIGAVIPADLPRVAQAMPGSTHRFAFVDTDAATKLWVDDAMLYQDAKKRLAPRVRNPHEMTDLLSYEFIGKPVSEDP